MKTLTDDDNAMTNAKYELVTLDGKVVANGSLDKGKNSLNLKLDNDLPLPKLVTLYSLPFTFNLRGANPETLELVKVKYVCSLFSNLSVFTPF